MKRAIITGATGTIGMALIRVLLQENWSVTALVNPDSRRLERLPKEDHLQVVRCALGELRTLDSSMIGRADAFFHLGWCGTTGALRNDCHLQSLNVEYSIDAVELAARCGCQVFVGAGSQAEYGRCEGRLTADTPTHPETGYGVAKLCAGQMTRLRCEQLGIRHVWTRILSIYGPYDTENSMIMSGIETLLRGGIPAFTPGEQQWDYLYCEDAARALYLAALRGVSGKIYPVGSGGTRLLKDYIEIMRCSVEHRTGRTAEVGIGRIPYQPGQVMYLCADLSELTQDTGFMPQISFEDGIAQTINWCINHTEG